MRQSLWIEEGKSIYFILISLLSDVTKGEWLWLRIWQGVKVGDDDSEFEKGQRWVMMTPNLKRGKGG